jgi:cytosine/uracil/thiamine/allantoin permease
MPLFLIYGSHVSTRTRLPYPHVPRAAFTTTRAHFPLCLRMTRISVVTVV